MSKRDEEDADCVNLSVAASATDFIASLAKSRYNPTSRPRPLKYPRYEAGPPTLQRAPRIRLQFEEYEGLFSTITCRSKSRPARSVEESSGGIDEQIKAVFSRFDFWIKVASPIVRNIYVPLN